MRTPGRCIDACGTPVAEATSFGREAVAEAACFGGEAVAEAARFGHCGSGPLPPQTLRHRVHAFWIACVALFKARHPNRSPASRGCRASRGSGPLPPRGLLRSVWHPVLIGLLCFAMSGCSRQYWREQADRKTYEAIGERFVDQRWIMPRADITPDPLSRFYDPYDPDCGPLPPDDAAAHDYMHCVYGMHGYKHWHAFGDLCTVENPDWLQPYGGSPGVVECNYGRPAMLPEIKNLTLEEALGLTYRHSREFQTEMENVYLNALALTFERFRFDTQFFGLSGQPPGADLTYDVRPNTQANLNLDSRAGISKLLPGGGQLAAELANNTVWMFSGPNSSNTQTILSYSIVQPLLRGGGRKFALESLTQTERDVLYAVRDFARFRMGFFTNVVAGTRSSGGISGVGGAFGSSQGGYLGLLQQHQQIQNQLFNIRLQEQQVEVLRNQSALPEVISERLEQFPPGLVIPLTVSDQLRYDPDRKLLLLRGRLTETQIAEVLRLTDDLAFREAVIGLTERASTDVTTLNVAQVENSLAQARITLANAQRQFQDNLDSFKLLMGLPPDVTLSIDTSMLKPFQLIDPRLVEIQDSFRFFVREVGDINEDDPDQQALAAVAAKLAELDETLRREAIDVITKDFERLSSQLEENAPQSGLPESAAPIQQMAAAVEEPTEMQDGIPDEGPPPYDPARDRQIFNGLQKRLTAAQAELQGLRGALEQPGLPVQARRDIRQTLLDVREEFYLISQGLALLQIDVRVEFIPLNDFALPLEEAVCIALENRTDLMNNRAVVMDTRRRIEVAANQLEAVLDVVARGDVRTRSLAQLNDNPVDFRAESSNYDVGVSFSTPVQLVQERNAYRSALIDYQRARRTYMRAEDQVKVDVRTAWRQLNVLRRNFALAKNNVRIAALQYDQTAEQTNAPVGGGAIGGRAGGGGNQGLQLLQAFNSVLQAQNTLIQIWVQYETNRLNIYRDMGTMVIDDRGFWIDRYYQERLAKANCVILPELREIDPPILVPCPPGLAETTLPAADGTNPADVNSAPPDGLPAPPDGAPQELRDGPPPDPVPPNPGPNLLPDLAPPAGAERRRKNSVAPS